MTGIPTSVTANDIEKYVEHGYAENNDVEIHYASLGSGPLIVMVHGFPDYWYTWRRQMVALAPRYQTVALDLRGYNLSDKPKGVENYRMSQLIGDVQAVVRQLGREKAIVIGHDWGAAICWQVAIHLPALVERLVILNMPHPRGLARELVHNPEQQRNSEYARGFQQEGAHEQVNREMLSAWVEDPGARERYREAFGRSDIEAMLNYYKQNYQHLPYREDPSPVIKVQAPVLQIHGLKDQFLLASALNGTWEWLENDWTLLTIPHAGHFVQHDAADLVTRSIVSWLTR